MTKIISYDKSKFEWIEILLFRGQLMIKNLLILILLLISSSAFSQKELFLDSPFSNRWTFGINVSGGLNFHTANIKGVDFPNIPSCCPRYETGFGTYYNFGVVTNFAFNQTLGLQLAVGYSNLSALLTKIEQEYVSTPSQGGVWGEFEHSLNAKINSIGGSLVFSYKLSEQLVFLVGPNAEFLLKKDYEQKEQIVSPSYGYFENEKSRVRNQTSGEIPNAESLLFGFKVGANYILPLNEDATFWLVPNLFVNLGVSPVAKNHSWNSHFVSGGLSFVYAPRKVKVIPPPPPPPINPPLPELPAPPKSPLLEATITAVSIDDKGRESPVTILKIEEFLSTKMHPILNYVFFDENSAEIPSRYVRLKPEETRNFVVRKLYGMGTLEIYYNVLNVVGRRVAQYPQAELKLVGCNSNTGAEANNLELSRRRAEAVKNYLVNVWNIAPERITIEARNLPENPSNPNDPDGIAENRRVEILANLPQIFEPLIVEDTLREVNPPKFRFKPEVKSAIGVERWQLITSQSHGIVKIFEGTGDVPKVIEWDVASEQQNVPKLDEPLQYKLVVVDKDNKVWESQTLQLPVEVMTIEKKIIEQVADKQIDRFSLILFGFGQTDITGDNLKIAEIAKKRIQPTSTVKIEGFTDRIGTEQINLDISSRRALATAKILGVDPKFARGLGKSRLLYNNDLPEGRFYCRTVNIEIVTPIE